MEITYFGHSAFRLRGKDVTVVTDPFPPGTGSAMGKVHADIVTVSQDQHNHGFVAGVDGDPRVVRGPGEYEVAEVLIAGVATASRPLAGAENTAFIFRFDDVAVCHLGMLRSKLTDGQIEEIGNVDVLMIPVGGNGSLDPTQAAEVVTQLEPSLVIPMEYRIEGVSPHLEPVDHFCREMGTKEFVPEPKLSVTRSTIPVQARVVVLENRRA